MKSLLVILCITAAAMGCNSSKNAAKLSDVKWILTRLNGRQIELKDPNNQMYIQFDDKEKRVNGRAVCNRFFGNYEQDGEKLKFSPMGATRMACPDLQLETEFFKMLDTVDTYKIKDNILYFCTKDTIVAAFKKGEESKG